MRNSAAILSVLISGCASQSNFLVGTWYYDVDRTQSELILNSQTPDVLLKCYEQKLCGDGSITYSESDWWQSSSTVFHVPGPRIPYAVETKSKNRIEIRTTSQGKEDQYVFNFMGHDEGYVEQNLNGFSWREYFYRER